MKLTELGLTKIVLDIRSQSIGRMYAKENEMNSRGLLVQLINQGVIKDIPEAEMYMYVRDKEGVVYEVKGDKVDANLFQIVYPAGMLTKGDLYAELRIFVGVDNIASKSFTISVDESIISDDIVSGENVPSLIDKMLDVLHQEEIRQQNEADRIELYNKVKDLTEDGSVIQGPQGPKGDKGDDGDKGDPGSDANVTEENITKALGYKPADESVIGDIGSVLDKINGEVI